MDTTTMYALAKQWADKGFQVNTHAIGDAANRIAIDVYDRLLMEEGATSNNDRRYRIEHAQILVSRLRHTLLLVADLVCITEQGGHSQSWQARLGGQCSAYTLHFGYGLCRLSSRALSCTGSIRMAVASLVRVFAANKLSID